MGNEETLVLDASAVLAILFAEERGMWAAENMNAAPDLLISAITVTEVVIQLLNRQPESTHGFEDWLKEAGIEVVSVDTAQALVAAAARRQYPLNIGDCFVYALAKRRGATILTLDKDFKNCDVRVSLPSA